jgi:hypothetical protein
MMPLDPNNVAQELVIFDLFMINMLSFSRAQLQYNYLLLCLFVRQPKSP